MTATTTRHRPPATPSAASPRPVLVAAFPVSAALDLPPDGTAVGRDWLAAAGVADREVSGLHVRFERRAGSCRVQDAGSRNGTWVDGAPLDKDEAAVLADGAVLRIGRTLLVYRETFEGELAPDPPLGEMVGPYGLREVRAALDAVARQRPHTVLVEGETGTGKELAARAVVGALGRAGRMVAVNIAGVAAGVFESQLFGRVAGAYSDARTPAKGVFAQHEGGAVVLDEVGELPLELQPKLLRLLENREILPVGAAQPSHVDVLIVAATNRDLAALVREGRFRRDLHARLNLATVHLPALRERPEDVFALGVALARRDGVALDVGAWEVEAVERLLLHDWSGNARELATALRQADALEPSAGLRLWSIERVLPPRAGQPSSGSLSRQVVVATLEECGSESEAARRLGVSRGKLRRYLGKG